MAAGLICLGVLLVIGTIITILGGVMFPVFSTIIHNELVQQTKLTNGTMGFDIWANPTADIYMQFWVWNLTNPAEVKAGKKPFLVQKGPYTYRENMPKEQIEPNNNGTVSYVTEKSYTLDLKMSAGDPRTDRFTTINVPLMTIAAMAESMGMPEFLWSLLNGEDPFPSHTVHEMIWGYKDSFLNILHKFGLSPYPEFGFFYKRNNSNDGIYTVYSGVNEDDTSQINHITRWKGEPNLGYWTTPEANMLNGSDGSYNPPFADKKEILYVFSSDICRSINAVYEKETSVLDIPTWRFVGPPEAFANATEYPPNVGFCTPDAGSCLPSGLLNVSNCQFGAPIVMSLPHFLYCDPISVIGLVGGVTPNKEEHQTFFDIEPMTGGPLNVAKRLQINTYIKPYEKLVKIKDLPTLFLPVIWLNESALLTKDGADELITKVEDPIMLTNVIKFGTLGLGGLMTIITIIVLTTLWIRLSNKQQAFTNENGSVNSEPAGTMRNTEVSPLLQ